MITKNTDEEPVPVVTATGNVYCTRCGNALGTYHMGAFRPYKLHTISVANVGHFCNQECKRKYGKI